MSPHPLQTAPAQAAESAQPFRAASATASHSDTRDHTPSTPDSAWMRVALAQAEQAGAAGEVPVGAVVVKNGQLVAVGRNAPVAQHDPCAHAEVQALRAAGQALGNYRLTGCTLYVTLEPCAMCSGALLHARVQRLVFGAPDPKTGAAGSVLNLFAQPGLSNAHATVEGGVLAAECADLLTRFFAPRRANTAPLREDALRTPDTCFATLTDWPWHTQTTTELPALAGLRLAWVDSTGTQADIHANANVHGNGNGNGNANVTTDANATTNANASQPTPSVVCLPPDGGWGHHLRHLLAALSALGWRVRVPDLIGFGRSDKPKKAAWHSVHQHTQVLHEWATHLGISGALWVLPHGGVTAEIAHALLRANPALASQVLAVLPSQAQATAVGHHAPFPDPGHRAGPRAFQSLAGMAQHVSTSPLNLDDPSVCAALARTLPLPTTPPRPT